MFITTKAMNNGYLAVAPTLTENTAEAVTTKTTTVKKTTEASTSNKFTTKQMVLAVVGTALAAGAGSVYVFSHLSSTDTDIDFFRAFDNKITVAINDNNTLNTDNETVNIKGKIVIEIKEEVPIENDRKLKQFTHFITCMAHDTIESEIKSIQNYKKTEAEQSKKEKEKLATQNITTGQ
jgi:hypothetical protein